MPELEIVRDIYLEQKVWEGLNPTKVYFEIKKEDSGKEVSIAWRTKEKVLQGVQSISSIFRLELQNFSL